MPWSVSMAKGFWPENRGKVTMDKTFTSINPVTSWFQRVHKSPFHMTWQVVHAVHIALASFSQNPYSRCDWSHQQPPLEPLHFKYQSPSDDKCLVFQPTTTTTFNLINAHSLNGKYNCAKSNKREEDPAEDHSCFGGGLSTRDMATTWQFCQCPPCCYCTWTCVRKRQNYYTNFNHK